MQKIIDHLKSVITDHENLMRLDMKKVSDNRLEMITKLALENERLKAYNGLRKECLKSASDEVASLKAEHARLRAELAASKLKWQTGPIPCDGFYFLRGNKDSRWRTQYMEHAQGLFVHGWEWAGPIVIEDGPSESLDEQRTGE